MPIGPGDDDIRGALDVLTGRELGELRPRDAVQGIPVELLEGLEVREPRLAQQTRYGAVAAGEHLALEQLQQELLVVPAVVRRLAHELRVVAAHRGHLQLPAVRLDDGRPRARCSRRSQLWLDNGTSTPEHTAPTADVHSKEETVTSVENQAADDRAAVELMVTAQNALAAAQDKKMEAVEKNIEATEKTLISAMSSLDSKIDALASKLDSKLGALDSKMNLLGLFVGLGGIAIALVAFIAGGDSGEVAITIELGDAMAELLPPR